jgi:hypothetical protein
MAVSCNRCGSPLIQINHRGDRLTGCPACSGGIRKAFIVELAVEDWEPLGKLRESVKWTLRPRRLGKRRNRLWGVLGLHEKRPLTLVSFDVINVVRGHGPTFPFF